MPKELVHKTEFISRKRTELEQQTRAGMKEYGYINPDGKALPQDYLVRVTSLRNEASVISPIQEPLRMKSTSKWDAFIPTSALGNQALQAATGRALLTQAMSRRIWSGSSPLILSLHLQFQAIKDSFMEVTEPVRCLQSMALPSDPSRGQGVQTKKFPAVAMSGGKGIVKAVKGLPLLIPPGPTPFQLNGMLDIGKGIDAFVAKWGGNGDLIIIEWGRLLTFNNVIIQEVSPVIYNMFDPSGNPIKATVDVVFETYEMQTVESLEKAFSKLEWADAQYWHNG